MISKTKRIQPRLVLGLMVVLWAGGAAMAAETVYCLRADVTTVTMPDSTVITMWGFAKDSAFGVEDGAVTVPGPALAVPPGDSLKIILKNNLTPERTGLPLGCPVCIVIPGQPVSMTPVRFGPAPYPEYEGRVRSMTYETPPGNTDPVEYTWPNMKPGTFLYHSGTHIQCHVQMGLYGAVTQDAAPSEAYPSVRYDREAVLLYSEIDPVFHEAVATGNYGPGKPMTSTIDYSPRYFLINGKPFTSPEEAFPTVAANQRLLLRFLNAGLTTHVPWFQNHFASLVAEDGNPHPFPQEQYALLLPAGKTLDAVLTPATMGRSAIADRMLSLTNAAVSPGGMLTYIDTTAPAFVVTSPDGGESWPLGSTQTVTWNGANMGASVKLKLWRNGAFTGYFLTGTEANDGRFTWKIPATLTPGPGYRIQAYTPDYSQSDFSNADFTLTSYPLQLTSPNGGESWAVGSTQTVAWNGPDVGPSVKLKLWRNGTFTGYFLGGILNNTGSYSWKIPSSLDTGTGYRIQVYTPDYTYSDLSDADFTLTSYPLQLTSPNGGESWALGSTQAVTWTGPEAGPSIKLKLWRDEAFTGYFLTGIEANDGSYSWTVPTSLAAGSGYKIQVYTPDYTYTDVSDNPFSLTP